LQLGIGQPHLPQSQWNSARTTNAIERLNEEFKRRIKTQTVLPCPKTVPMLLWALMASGQIWMRNINFHHFRDTTLLEPQSVLIFLSFANSVRIRFRFIAAGRIFLQLGHNGPPEPAGVGSQRFQLQCPQGCLFAGVCAEPVPVSSRCGVDRKSINVTHGPGSPMQG
jgi:mutator family transposase